MTHRIEVAAPAKAVYRDRRRSGPAAAVLPPTVRAERTGGDGTEERIRIWALANGDLRTWESRRRLDPVTFRIEFEQIQPREPVAAMGGTWRITERGDGGCTVELDHFYRAVDGDPVAHERITRAVDTNSRSELEHPRRAAERGDAGAGAAVRLRRHRDHHRLDRGAYAFIYEASRWPERLPHVARIELREEETGLQFMEMDTRSPGRLAAHHGVRPGLRAAAADHLQADHSAAGAPGAQRGVAVRGGPGGHREGSPRTIKVLLDPAGIEALPHPPATLADARQAVRHALGSNSRATMARAREFAQDR
ncbi:aromatase/cyclase [Streptomyces tricolor]|nr:aromatase/cyclase [Streptomyces tricolor]